MSSVMLIVLVGSGLVLTLGGGGGMLYGWRQRKPNQLITETETTDIRAIDREGPVELTGTISSAATGTGFTSPLGQQDQTVFAGWEVEEWDDHTQESAWIPIASGTVSEPFYLDDGTARVRVAIEDRSLAVRWEFADVPVVEEVDVDADTPTHISDFVRDEPLLAEQSGSITNRVDVGQQAHGDRRYAERALGPGAEIYLLGYVHALDGATRPLQPEDVVVTTTDDGPFILSDLPEDELIDQISTTSREIVVAGAIVSIFGLCLLGLGAVLVLTG